MTVRVANLTHLEVMLSAALPEPAVCAYCGELIVYMSTYHQGRKFGFDAVPQPRNREDRLCGWVSGQFRIDGVMQPVMAPVILVPRSVGRRAKTTMRLHECERAA